MQSVYKPFSNQKAVRLSPEKEVEGHPLGPALLHLSPHQNWLASVGRDGLLCIHDITTLVISGLEQVCRLYICLGLQCADILYWSVSYRRSMCKSNATLGGWEEFALCLSPLTIRFLSLPASEMALWSVAGSGRNFCHYIETDNCISIAKLYEKH